MTECKSCNKKHFIPSDSGFCLLCDMRAKKSATIKAFIEKNVTKVEETVGEEITIDMF